MFFPGNHDVGLRKMRRRRYDVPKNVTVCTNYGVHQVGGLLYRLGHKPRRFNAPDDNFPLLHGHSHGHTTGPRGNSLDVGWDQRNKILSIDEIQEILEEAAA